MRKHAPGMTAELVRENKHVLVDFKLGDKTYRATMSKSPRDEDHHIKNTCADICRAFNLPRPF